MTDRPLRFGYHGSTALPARIARAAGMRSGAVELCQYSPADPFRLIRAGELDLMVVKFALREPDLSHSAVVATDPRAAVVAAGHPLARRDSVSVEELADLDTFHRPGSMPDYVWDEVIPPVTPGGRRIRRRHRITTTEQLFARVAEGRAVHLSLLSIADVAPPTVRVVPVSDLPPAPVALAWPTARADDRVLALVTAAEAPTFVGVS